MDGMLSHIVNILEAKKIIERKRKNMKWRGLGIMLYHYGLYLRKCESVLSCFEPVSYELIRKWYHKAHSRFYVETAYHEVIAVDETKVKFNGILYILWAAVDTRTWEVLGIWVSKGRASLEAYNFLKHVLSKCENQPKILVDGGPWYKSALNRLHADLEHVIFGLRNPIEQWFFILKYRIILFYRNWPYHSTIDTVREWMESFVSMYHITRWLS